MEKLTITRNLYDVELPSDGKGVISCCAVNPKGADFRPTLAQTQNKNSDLSYTANVTEIHHGKMKLQGQSKSVPATLIILEFSFHNKCQSTSKRYTSVQIDMLFRNAKGDGRNDPEVLGIAPEGSYYLNQTTKQTNTTLGGALGANVGLGALAGVEVGVTLEISKERTKEYQAKLTGATRLTSPNSIWKKAAQWSMYENNEKKDGIPTLLQTAVLLRRRNDDPFKCQLELTSRVNINQKIVRFTDMFTGASDEDKNIDPITIHPKRKQLDNSRATGIQSVDLEHMETLREKIGSYCKVSFSQPAHTLASPITELPTPPPSYQSGWAEQSAVVVGDTRPEEEPHSRLKPTIRKSVGFDVPNPQKEEALHTSTAYFWESGAMKMIQETSGTDASTLHALLLTAQEEAAEATAAATRAAKKAMEAMNEATAAAVRASKATNLLAEVTCRMATSSDGRCQGITAAAAAEKTSRAVV